jgi:FkbM family methyltransferase
VILVNVSKEARINLYKGRLPWNDLPPEINKWCQEQVFKNGGTQNYRDDNFTFYADEVDSINEWLIPNISGKVFYDVGAFIGIWSVIAVRCGAREVHLFDHADHLKQGEENVKRAGNVPVFVNKKRITNTQEYEEYLMAGDIEDPFRTHFETLDHYVQTKHTPPDFIKIDTEGEEIKVLEGARELISFYKPMLMVENHSAMEQTRIDEITSLVGPGYSLAPIRNLDNHSHMFFVKLP